ncbi:MAG TPA: iron-containing alcohol dehydrogenase [Paenalcaligenes sp.]|nr:iron-containing alcohol dehydrogenase [Paenalcaligenes sp.]
MTAYIVQPRNMIMGGGALSQAAELLEKLDVDRPFIITDQFMVDSGTIQKLLGPLDAAGLTYEVFSDTVPDPTVKSINVGVEQLKRFEPDCVIALGGGSPLDSAKAIAFLAVHGGQMSDYKVPVVSDIPGLPVIAIPTTAGTGSEMTRFTIITEEETNEKMLCAGAAFCPTAAIVDYELTLTKPTRLTADTGLDTLTHAIEAYVSKRHNPYASGFAQLAMQELGKHLRTVCYEPDNHEAREAIMLAATLAGAAFTNSSVCLVHGMSRPLGAFFHVPHGLSNAMLLPAVTAFSISAAPQRYADCARFMGLATTKESDEVANDKLLAELAQLNVDLQVPTPKEYGIDKDEYFSVLSTMAEQALASGSPGNNPRVPTKEEIVELYKKVWM